MGTVIKVFNFNRNHFDSNGLVNFISTTTLMNSASCNSPSVEILKRLKCLRRYLCLRKRDFLQHGTLKGWFTLDAEVCVFRSGLRQCRDWKFSISLPKRNHLPQTHVENAGMWMTLKPEGNWYFLTRFASQIN